MLLPQQYKSHQSHWEKNASVRSKPRKLIQMDMDRRYYFPESKQPIVSHPIIKKRGEEAKKYILLQSFYKFMHEVATIETEVVNSGALIIANNSLTQYKFPKPLQLDAFSVIIDEAYHAYVAFDFLSQVISVTKIEPIPIPIVSPVISALQVIRAEFPPEIQDVFTVIAVCIGEHVLIKDIISTSKEKNVIKAFSELMIDHIKDEGRHSKLFSTVMSLLWNNLETEVKDLIGPKLLNYFQFNFSLNSQKEFERQLLLNLGLKHEEIEAIITDVYSKEEDQIISLSNPVIYNITAMLKRCGLFNHGPTYKAFSENHLIPNEYSDLMPTALKARQAEDRHDRAANNLFKKHPCSELIIHMPIKEQNYLTKMLQEACIGLNQEKEPHQLALAAKHSILGCLEQFPEFKDTISQFSSLASPPYLLLRNFIAINNLAPTPTDDNPPALEKWKTAVSALLGVLLISGHHARAFEDEMGGRLAHMVMPANNNERSFMRSTKKLDFHTEVLDGLFQEEVSQAGPPLSPELIALICLRNLEKAATTLLPLEFLLKDLSPATIDILMSPIFTVTSQSYSDRQLVVSKVPLIKKLARGYLGIRYNHYRIETDSSIGSKALKKLQQLVANHPKQERLELQPGDILMINNRTCLHGRDSLVENAKFDGSDRWLIRLYGYNDTSLAKITKCPKRPHIMLSA